MCLLEVFKIPSWVSLLVVMTLLGGSVVWSLKKTASTPPASS